MIVNPDWEKLGKFIFAKNPYPNVKMTLGPYWQLRVEIIETHSYWHFDGKLKYVEKAMRIAYIYEDPPGPPAALAERGINVDHLLIGYENNEEYHEVIPRQHDPNAVRAKVSEQQELGQFIFGQNPLTAMMTLDPGWENLHADEKENRWHFDGKALYVKQSRRIPYTYPGTGKQHAAALLLGYEGGAGH